MGFETATSSGRSRFKFSVRRGVLSLLSFSVCYFLLSVTEIQLCKVNAHFLNPDRLETLLNATRAYVSVTQIHVRHVDAQLLQELVYLQAQVGTLSTQVGMKGIAF